MGIDVGPIEVTDGLVFQIDAGNTRSYSGSGITVNVLAGFGGTLVNGVGFTSSNFGSFVFDGTNDFINLGNNISNSYSALTIESIFKVGITNKKQAILSTYSNSIGWGLEILDNTLSNKFNFFGFASAGIVTGLQSSSSAVLNQTYNVSAVFSGSSSVNIYVNGILESTLGTSLSSFSKNSSANLQIGDDPETGQSIYFQGNIYQVKFYNRALTSQEIFQNYTATKGRYR